MAWSVNPHNRMEVVETSTYAPTRGVAILSVYRDPVDAKLIAAAPELSLALQRALSYLSSYPGENGMSAYEQAVVALKKAGVY